MIKSKHRLIIVLAILIFEYAAIPLIYAEGEIGESDNGASVSVTTQWDHFNALDGLKSSTEVAPGFYQVAQDETGRLLYFVNQADVRKWARQTEALAALFLHHHYQHVSRDIESACACPLLRTVSQHAEELAPQESTLAFRISFETQQRITQCMQGFLARATPRLLVFGRALSIVPESAESLLMGQDLCQRRSPASGPQVGDASQANVANVVELPRSAPVAAGTLILRNTKGAATPLDSTTKMMEAAPSPFIIAKVWRPPLQVPSARSDAPVSASNAVPSRYLQQPDRMQHSVGQNALASSLVLPSASKTADLAVSSAAPTLGVLTPLRNGYNLQRVTGIDGRFPLRSDGTPGAHAHARHGYQVTQQQNIARVQTGITPDHIAGQSPEQPIKKTTTSYKNIEAELEAVDKARLAAKKLKAPILKSSASGKSIPDRFAVVVNGRRNGYGRGVAVLSDSKGATLPGRPIEVLPSQPNAKVVFAYSSKTKKMEILTSHPTSEPVTPGTSPGRLQALRFAARPVIRGALGALGVVGGAFQLRDGIEELRAGQKVVGALDAGGGIAGGVAGVATWASRVAVGTAAGGAVALLDGTKDLVVGIREGNTERKVVGGVKLLAGGAMVAGLWFPPAAVVGGAVYLGSVIYANRKGIWNWVKSRF